MADHVEYGSTGKPHPYHLVRPSIWPLAGALAGGLLALGLILFMHEIKWGVLNVGVKGIVLGVTAVAAVMFFW